MRSFLFECYRFYKEISRDHISIYAAQASFFLILSIAPMLMLILSLLQYIPSTSKTQLLKLMLVISPDVLDSFFVNTIEELYSNTSITLISITSVTALWSASRGIMAVVNGLSNIEPDNAPRNYIEHRLLSLLYTLVFILIVVFSLVVLVFGNTLQYFLETKFPVIAQISAYILDLRALIAIGVLTFFFAVLYKLFPKRKTTLKAQLPGALFATFGWLLFSLGFSIYIDHFSNYTSMYGSLATIMFLMLWLYACMNIVLFGAELNLYLQKKH